MRTAPIFIGAALPWLRDASPEVAEEVFGRLDRVISTSKYQRELVMRPSWVLNTDGNPISAAAEPLSRWDSRPPSVIFQDGFQPHEAPMSIEKFRKMDDFQLSLHRFVNDQPQSIFVSTTRPVSSKEGKAEIWRPNTISGKYRYEIFAYGGIDVLATFERQAEIFYPEQHEITFIGGIRPELIRTATEYNERGQIISKWYNVGFDAQINGIHAPKTDELPPVLGEINKTRFVHALYQRVEQPSVPSELESVSPKHFKAAESAERISEKEFIKLASDYQLAATTTTRAASGGWSKSVLKVREKLNYHPISPTSKLWGDFGKLKMTFFIAGIGIYVDGFIHAWTHNATDWEFASAAFEIIPFLGCSIQAIARIKEGKIDAADASLCLIADGLLVTPLFPFGVLVHIARAVMAYFSGPDIPSQEEYQTERDASWNKFLYDNFYAPIYSHPSLCPEESCFRDKVQAAITVETLAVLSQGSQAIGVVQAMVEHNLTSNSSEFQNRSVSLIQELHNEMYPEIIRRQRQYLINLSNIMKNDSDARMGAVADQFNNELWANITSFDTAKKYFKPILKSWRLPAPRRANEMQVYADLRAIATHLLRHPLVLPGLFDIAYTIGQSVWIPDLKPDVLSPMKFMQEKVRDEAAANMLCRHHARQIEQLLQGKIAENQLSNGSSVLDDESTRNLQILLALKLGRMLDDDKSEKLRAFRSVVGGEWKFNVIYQESPEWREHITHPHVPSVKKWDGNDYFKSPLDFSDGVIAQACHT
ncbi:hypothetical protein QQS21_005679 [Conoideocrella luteorostrata]|uniref:Pierisin-like domain-containing protein n=1 Tax=Conoideocrella luteorostrata TaxID=1105319 RepID=A0AAJ0CP02_9HYPO|nr:hypothetical protein QQS21_005679 [Conoideocrella luteorostrata]